MSTSRLLLALVAVVSSALAVSACRTGASHVRDGDSGAPRIAQKTCELKGDSPGCEDGRGGNGRAGKEQRKTTYVEFGPCRVADKFPDETLDQWQKRDPAGVQCVKEEMDRTLAGFETAPDSGTQRTARQSATPSADTDTSGTWYCDTVDGSGVYGVHAMRDLPDIDASTCKKVSN